MTTAPSTSSHDVYRQQPSESKGQRARIFLQRLMVVLAAAVLGYGVAAVQGWQRSRELAQRHQTQLAESQDRYVQAQGRLRQSESIRADLARKIQLLDVYREVQHALLALDARNFGTAEAQLRNAERRLSGLVDALPSAAPVLAALRGIHVEVAQDFGNQRNALLQLLASLDQRIEAAVPAL